ncbi:MAG: hypothetical protein R3B11_19160 [Nitrospira sp.]|jgi:uncharacterized Zn finger protein|nr:hypothetical protein [Nitrospira sp.]MCW5787858.1 hypothetical protein [Nitrospira sp.]MDR4471237.1 hypothetical protein [Nitrospira sp.]MDR4478113.1 hypothetical protein [Nitrospira sp.]HAP42077.1 hypothetical protein [Nitrospira sp.]
MSCMRCAGLLISDHHLGLEGALSILRCLNCGAVRESRMDFQRTRPVRGKRKEPRQTNGRRRQPLLIR